MANSDTVATKKVTLVMIVKDESRVKQLTTKRKKQSEINNKENPDKIKTRSQLKQENNSKKSKGKILF